MPRPIILWMKMKWCSRAVGNLWAHNEEQDSRLDEHDKRITVLEKK